VSPYCDFVNVNSETHEANIAFTESIVLQSLEPNDLQISMEGPLAPYEFDFEISPATGYVVGNTVKSFKIKLKFKTSLYGDLGGKPRLLICVEKIIIVFNRDKFLDTDGNRLMTETAEAEIDFFLIVISDEERQAAEAQSGISIISIILTFGTSILFSVVLGNQIEATWLLLGTLQLMSLTPLFNLNLPQNFRVFSVNLAVLHGEPQFLPNLFEYMIDQKGLEPFNPYFDLMSNRSGLIFRFQNEFVVHELWQEDHDLDIPVLHDR